MRLLINADDFGLHESCSKAILEAFANGYISSTSMCANGAYFDEACRLGKAKQLEKRIGIHLNLTEGLPITDAIRRNPNFCGELGQFHGHVSRLKPLTGRDKKMVDGELSAQIERMRTNGLPITHADSHHHIHTALFISPVVLGVLERYEIKKIRIHRNVGSIPFPKQVVKYLYNNFLLRKGFYTVDRFGSFADFILATEIHRDSTIEIMVHPEYDDQQRLIDKTNWGVPRVERTLQEVASSLKIADWCSYSDL